MVFYSLITGVSLAQLMVAGLLPGLLSIFLYLIAIRATLVVRPASARRAPVALGGSGCAP